jgi:tryptophanyl-tRNA synthetase
MYLACGVDANKAFIYRQSDIPEIVQLYFLLSMITPVGELQRCTTYKDKVANMESNKKLISLGLLSYPALMAADILFANAQIVPVGKDQEQHLEITREIARKYNHHFAKNIRFSEPQNLTTKSIKVPGLLNGKMSKSVGSEDNVIYLLDDEKTIRRKIKGAKTDSGPVESQEMGEDMKNIFQLMSLCCKKDIYKKFLDKYNNCETKFYGDLKNSLADAVVEMLAPIQDRYYNSSECSEESVKQILVEHTRVVRPIAQRTLRAVQQDLGFNDLALKI